MKTPEKSDGCLFGCVLMVLVALFGSLALGAGAAVVVNLVQAGWEAVR